MSKTKWFNQNGNNYFYKNRRYFMKLNKKQLTFIINHPPDSYGTDGGIVWEDLVSILDTKCPNISDECRINKHAKCKEFEQLDDKMTKLYNYYMPIINYKTDKIQDLMDKGEKDISIIPNHPEAIEYKKSFLNDLDQLYPKIKEICPKFTKSDLQKVKKRVVKIYQENK